MRTPSLLLLTALALGCQSSDDKSAPSGSTSAAAAPGAVTPASAGGASAVDRKPTADFPGDEAGARKLLSKFLEAGTDRAALTKALQPDPADYAAVFEGETAAKAQAGYTPLWAGIGNDPVGAKEGQTELKLSSATTEDLQAGNDKAGEFPGGYKKVADKLKKGLVFYRWKFVKPGESLGMAFDGLVFVNGHWAWFPKPWRIAGGD